MRLNPNLLTATPPSDRIQ
ncbi:hypothetical protein D0A37_09795 [Microcoleus vaginatus HSN003]|nr:hypothetical protein D0A37_09795 [Microcoleus vaginatus HSN003]